MKEAPSKTKKVDDKKKPYIRGLFLF